METTSCPSCDGMAGVTEVSSPVSPQATRPVDVPRRPRTARVVEVLYWLVTGWMLLGGLVNVADCVGAVARGSAASQSMTAGAPQQQETLSGGAGWEKSVEAGRRYSAVNPVGAAVSGFIAWGIIGLLPFLAMRAVRRRNKRVTEKAEEWEAAIQRWGQLCYCSGCDRIFFGGSSVSVARKQLDSLLYQMEAESLAR